MGESQRLKREMPGAWFYKIMGVFMSAKARAVYDRFSGYALLERTATSGEGS